MALEWSNDLSTGVVEIDEQHKELIKNINMLLKACQEGKGKEILGDMIDFLGKYVVTHFSTEERYMDKYKYPDKTAHRQEHKYFFETFENIKQNHFNKNEILLTTIKLNDLLVKWLVNHIKKTDKSMGDFISKSSVKT